MNSRTSLLEHPLDWIFSAPSHIAVLRALRDSKEGMSGRAVAREAGINHQACAQAIKRLEAQGVIRRQGSGQTQLIHLNFDNVLVQEVLLSLVRKEREFWFHAQEEIAEKFKSMAHSATLFGSAARGEAQLGSDVDLLLTVEPRLKSKILEEARHFSQNFKQKYGVQLSPIVFTVQEVKARIKKSDPLIRSVLKEGIELLPSTMEELAP
ncbi:MAG: MarR family transcriptional regulator [Elusimicrobia bacterium]|nr:MarR family transcriptional regulator [Elusimicrobiota bacterium]